jgi:hypothetical protein
LEKTISKIKNYLNNLTFNACNKASAAIEEYDFKLQFGWMVGRKSNIKNGRKTQYLQKLFLICPTHSFVLLFLSTNINF